MKAEWCILGNDGGMMNVKREMSDAEKKGQLAAAQRR